MLLQDGNNLEKSSEAEASEALAAALGEKFRRFLDTCDISDVLQMLNPKTLSTVSRLFPDAKYDVAFLPQTFEVYDEKAVYNAEETSWLLRIRGSPQDCYLSKPKDGESPTPTSVSHLLKTQKHLDPSRVDFYSRQFQEALKVRLQRAWVC